MKKNLIPLTVFLLFFFSNSSFAQTNNDKAIFGQVFKDVSKDDRPFKNYRYVSLDGTLVITFKDGEEKTYNATSRSRAKRTNYENFKKDDFVYLLNHKSLIKGSFQGIEGQFILLKMDDEIKKYHTIEADYILTDTQNKPL
ncbi:hypothetical protein [Chishuiella changwenlii]|uniref:hypothetical protein n=1 Tax=Chishuiella changwenlii TaxID=1434701 RepID=UPI002FDB7D2B